MVVDAFPLSPCNPYVLFTSYFRLIYSGLSWRQRVFHLRRSQCCVQRMYVCIYVCMYVVFLRSLLRLTALGFSMCAARAGVVGEAAACSTPLCRLLPLRFFVVSFVDDLGLCAPALGNHANILLFGQQNGKRVHSTDTADQSLADQSPARPPWGEGMFSKFDTHPTQPLLLAVAVVLHSSLHHFLRRPRPPSRRSSRMYRGSIFYDRLRYVLLWCCGMYCCTAGHCCCVCVLVFVYYFFRRSSRRS